MKRIVIALLLATVPCAPALAKKKKKHDTSAETKKGKGDADKSAQPGDKRTNEGAQGRINATEDAARGADSPQFDHRP
jgi:hypothetical protein